MQNVNNGGKSLYSQFYENANEAMGDVENAGYSAKMTRSGDGSFGKEIITGKLTKLFGKFGAGMVGTAVEYKFSFDKLHRSKDQKNMNNQVRQMFLTALRTELVNRGFGGMTFQNMPKEIKDALRLSDFGLSSKDGWDSKVTTGKPLTARRIVAINRALENVLGQVQDHKTKSATGIALGVLTGRTLPSENAALRKYPEATRKNVRLLYIAAKDMLKYADRSHILNFRFNGVDVQFENYWKQDHTAVLAVTVNGIRTEVPGGAAALLEGLERDIALNAKFYGARLVGGLVAHVRKKVSKHPDSQADTSYSSRLSVFYTRIIRGVLGEDAFKSLPLSTVSQMELGQIAMSLLNGNKPNRVNLNEIKERISNAPGMKEQINSGAVLQLLEEMKEHAAEDAKDRVDIAPPKPTVVQEKFADKIEHVQENEVNAPQKQAEKKVVELAPKDKAVHDFLADLILRGDTWEKDKDGKAGTSSTVQLLDTCIRHVSALKRVLADDTAFDSFDMKLGDGEDGLSVKAKLKEALGAAFPSSAKLMATLPDKVLIGILNVLKDMAACKSPKAADPNDALTDDQKQQFTNRLKKVLSDEIDANAKQVADLQAKADEAGLIGGAFILARKKALELSNFMFKQMANRLEQELDADFGLEVLENFDKAANSLDEKVGEMMAFVQDAVESSVQKAFNLSDAEMDELRTIQEVVEERLSGGGDAQDEWKKTLKDITGDAVLNPKSGLGKFTFQSLMLYYKNVSAIDQKAMLTSLLRNTHSQSTPGEALGAILKGAGPFMQKLMQGLPMTNMPEELQTALADMKDKLAPIPEQIVKAQMDKMVRESNGTIKSVTVDRSLGAASVGQAFLCTLELADGTKEECVVKLLRPDVQNRAQRERAFFEKVAKGIQGMSQTFAGDLRTIMDELDLTIEAENIRQGQIYAGHPDTGIACVEIHPLVQPTANLLVLKKAPGTTVSGLIREMRDRLAEIKKATTVINNGIKSHQVTGVKDMVAIRAELKKMHDDLKKANDRLSAITREWTSEAMFLRGFFHGDMHAGNMMIDVSGDEPKLTVIDFGNATKLTQEEQTNVVLLLLASGARNADKFSAAFKALLSPEGQRTFARFEKELKKEIETILNMGDVADSANRMMAVMMSVQKRGIELPSSIYKFVKSELRLAESAELVGAAMAEIESFMATLSVDNSNDRRNQISLFNELDVRADLAQSLKDGCSKEMIKTGLWSARRMTMGRYGDSHTISHRITVAFKDGNLPYLKDGLIEKASFDDVMTVYLRGMVNDDGTDIEEVKVTNENDPPVTINHTTTVRAKWEAFVAKRKALNEELQIPNGSSIREEIEKLKGAIAKLDKTTPDIRKARARLAKLEEAQKSLADNELKELACAAQDAQGCLFQKYNLQFAETSKFAEFDSFEQTQCDELLHHTGDALDLVGLWTGTKLARSTTKFTHQERDRRTQVEGVTNTTVNGFIDLMKELVVPGGGIPGFAESYMDAGQRQLLQTMSKDFVVPPNFRQIMGKPGWADDEKDRKSVLDVLSHNLKAYVSRLKAAGRLPGVRTVFGAPNYELEEKECIQPDYLKKLEDKKNREIADVRKELEDFGGALNDDQVREYNNFLKLEREDNEINQKIVSLKSYGQSKKRLEDLDKVDRLLPKWEEFKTKNLSPEDEKRALEKDADLRFMSQQTNLYDTAAEREAVTALQKKRLNSILTDNKGKKVTAESLAKDDTINNLITELKDERAAIETQLSGLRKTVTDGKYAERIECGMQIKTLETTQNNATAITAKMSRLIRTDHFRLAQLSFVTPLLGSLVRDHVEDGETVKARLPEFAQGFKLLTKAQIQNLHLDIEALDLSDLDDENDNEAVKPSMIVRQMLKDAVILLGCGLEDKRGIGDQLRVRRGMLGVALLKADEQVSFVQGNDLSLEDAPPQQS